MTKLTIEKKRKEAVGILLKEMETTAASMRALIVSTPPKDLIGYIYAQLMMKMMSGSDPIPKERDADSSNDVIDETQFLLEYVHAVLASDVTPTEAVFDEAQCVELLLLSRKLREQAMNYAMGSSADTENEEFGPNTAEIEFHIKSAWILLRGNRYQVLEGEFYRYMLAPHDDVLKEVYGIESTEIAAGFQDMANAMRSGPADAMTEMMKHMEAAHNFAAEQNKPLEDVMEEWTEANTDQVEAVKLAREDIFRGGIANVSHHTKLPRKLLADLAYQRGEEIEFFSEGDYAGTPYRTLPARKKPLIQLGSEYYAVDPCFTRDAGYRALLFNLLQRKPDYKKSFEERQKVVSEKAFPDILISQLSGATIYQEVYYRDPVTGQWCENDTLILVDDVLYLVEAKAGAAATIASPELDFKRHAQSVNDLIIKAYTQCERFFNYLGSAEEVALFVLTDGGYEECGQVRRSDYRVMIPIGLTVESFSPFSSVCKELPQLEPLLGKHAFVSISIDDLLVLKRFLPTSGMFAHYMEVRQSVAGMRRSLLFDELDHLGAYITRNRFDQDIAAQLKESKFNLVVWDGMSDVVDMSFEGEGWEATPMPTQQFPDEVLKLLRGLDTTQAPRWLLAESIIRNYDEASRKSLAKLLSDISKTTEQHPERYFAMLGGSQPLFVWRQSVEQDIDWAKINDKASAAALCTKSSDFEGVLVETGAAGDYEKVQHFKIHVPSEQTEENMHIFDEAQRMSQRTKSVSPALSADTFKPENTRKIGRNEACPCGSGAKYKKCHGR